MRALILVAFALLAAVPIGGNAQDDPSYYDQVVAQDDRTACDETGWSVLETEITSTQSMSFMIEHAACIDGENGLILLSGCMEPVFRTMAAVAPDPGEAWVSCSVMVSNGSVEGFLISPTDFSLVDSRGTQYPFSLAASVIPSSLRPQELPLRGDPVVGLVTFAIPEATQPPYLLVWEPGVNGVALDPVWIVVDRLIELPEALT